LSFGADIPFGYTGFVRRVLSISMLLLFSFSLISPLIGSDAVEANLPACCRRGGKHHCALLSESLSKQGKSIGIIAEECPFTPAVPAVAHFSAIVPPIGDAVFAGLISHPAIHPQTAAKYRISFDRSRQKRGPPSLILL